MLDYAQLAALHAVHRRGSFELAAASLGVTPSAISQRIRALEESQGALLIHRGHPCHATAVGARLLRHFEAVALMEASLARDLPRQDPALPVLRIAVNADSLATWVLPALSRLNGWLFDLVIDDQDHSREWLRRGEVVAAITGEARALQGCDTIALGALRYYATASPDFMARWLPEGPSKEALARAPSLMFSDKDRLQRDWLSAQLGERIAPPVHRIASSQAFVDACLLGIGWGMNPEILVREHLASGRLCELIPERAMDVPLYWQFMRLGGEAMAEVTREIRQAAAQVLQPVTP